MTRIARFALARTRRASRKYREVKSTVLGGSFAKGTWLSEHADIDIFVRIDPATPEGRFEEVGLAIGAEAMRGFPLGKKFAQHPYTEATVEGTKINIVPCYAVKKREWKSAVDRSPFHVSLVRRLPEGQKTQIRLLKRFMRAIGVYGAEIETQGFSGYAAEVLTIQHGDVAGVLGHFSKFSRASADKLFFLPDPVDPSRDLAVAISGEKFGRMILASREFLRNPSQAYFERMSGRARPSMRGSVVAVVFTHPPLSEDTLWGELRRTMRHFVRHVEVRGFKVARALAASNNVDSSAFLFVPEFDRLPRLEQRVGPTVDMKEETRSFISSNSGRARLVWVDDEARVRILQAREYTALTRLLEDLARGRVGSVGASAEVAEGMVRSAKVISGRRLARFAESEKWMARGVLEIVSDAIGTRAY